MEDTAIFLLDLYNSTILMCNTVVSSLMDIIYHVPYVIFFISVCFFTAKYIYQTYIRRTFDKLYQFYQRFNRILKLIENNYVENGDLNDVTENANASDETHAKYVQVKLEQKISQPNSAKHWTDLKDLHLKRTHQACDLNARIRSFETEVAKMNKIKSKTHYFQNIVENLKRNIKNQLTHMDDSCGDEIKIYINKTKKELLLTIEELCKMIEENANFTNEQISEMEKDEKNNILKLRSDYENILETLQGMMEKLHFIDAKLCSLEHSNDLQTVKQELQKFVDNLDQVKCSTELKLKNIEQNFEIYKDKLHKAKDEEEKQQFERLEALETAMFSLYDKYGNVNANVDSLTESVAQMHEWHKFNSVGVSTNSNGEHCPTDCETIRNQNERLSRDLKNCTDELSLLQNINQNYNRELEKLKSHVISIDSRNRSLCEQVRLLGVMLKEYKDDKLRLEETCKELHQLNRTVQDLANLKCDHQQLVKNVDEIHSTNNVELMTLKKERKDDQNIVMDEMNGVKTAIGEIELKNQGFQREVEYLEAELNVMKEEYQQLNVSYELSDALLVQLDKVVEAELNCRDASYKTAFKYIQAYVESQQDTKPKK